MQPDEILKTLEQAGFEAYYVGGCVRDRLLGRPVHDWDITTSALPEQVMALFPRCVPTGIRHGTISVFSGGESAEVTTFRRDGAYHDGRHPEAVVFVPSLKEDLARRDFTINAMAMDLRGTLTDLFGGWEDLKAGRIRCVGEPARRFQEDALRMLRAYRFSAQLGFSLERGTAQAVAEHAPLCRKLSKERVREEAEKTLLSPRPELLGKMIELGLLAACKAEGRHDLSSLSELPSEKEVRWAAFSRLLPQADLREFRLPAQLVRLCESAAQSARNVYTRQEMKNLLASQGEGVARVCAAMSGETALLDAILASGECVSLRQLAVSGRDLAPLSGEKVGKMLQRLLAHVLSHPEENDRQTLLRLAAGWSDTDSDDDVSQVQREHERALKL